MTKYVKQSNQSITSYVDNLINEEIRDLFPNISIIGARPTNEDRHRIFHNMDVEYSNHRDRAPIDVCIICDGHGGSEVAKFVAPALEDMFINEYNYPLSDEKIILIFDCIQRKLRFHPDNIARYCGCTALVVIRYSDKNNVKHLQIINLGDSRAVLSHNGLAIPLTKDHKPNWPDEKARLDLVNKQGKNKPVKFDGADWRVGDLSLSRSFGDLDNVPHVSHKPEIFKRRIVRGDEFIVMGCDGLFDVLQNHDIINFVRDHLTNNTGIYKEKMFYDKPKGDVAKLLSDYAIKRESTDNISIIIIKIETNFMLGNQ